MLSSTVFFRMLYVCMRTNYKDLCIDLQEYFRFINPNTWSFYFQDEELKHNVSEGIIMSNQSLVLQGINREAAGNYTCIATNAEGSISSNSLHLSVMCKFFSVGYSPYIGQLKLHVKSYYIWIDRLSFISHD